MALITDNIPILNQPYSIVGWIPVLNLVCHCDGDTPLIVTDQGPNHCPKCKKGFMVRGVQVNPQNPQQLGFAVAIMTPQKENNVLG